MEVREWQGKWWSFEAYFYKKGRKQAFFCVLSEKNRKKFAHKCKLLYICHIKPLDKQNIHHLN